MNGKKPGIMTSANIERLGGPLWKYEKLALLLAETVLKVVMYQIFLIKRENQSSRGKNPNNAFILI